MEGNECPSCETGTLTVQKKGYGAGKGCCGTLCMGPIGLLCGAFGANKMYAVCPNCGHKKKLGKMAHVSRAQGFSKLQAVIQIAGAWSCHRMPSRSFHIEGKPMPMCARCLGVAMGHVVALGAWLTLGLIGPLFAVVLMAVCFADWAVQRWAGWESTNPRRLVTGLVGGFGMVAFGIWVADLFLM